MQPLSLSHTVLLLCLQYAGLDCLGSCVCAVCSGNFSWLLHHLAPCPRGPSPDEPPVTLYPLPEGPIFSRWHCLALKLHYLPVASLLSDPPHMAFSSWLTQHLNMVSGTQEALMKYLLNKLMNWGDLYYITGK